jgi:hypothetical protein
MSVRGQCKLFTGMSRHLGRQKTWISVACKLGPGNPQLPGPFLMMPNPSRQTRCWLTSYSIPAGKVCYVLDPSDGTFAMLFAEELNVDNPTYAKSGTSELTTATLAQSTKARFCIAGSQQKREYWRQTWVREHLQNPGFNAFRDLLIDRN